MTDKKSFADCARDHNSAMRLTPTRPSERRRWAGVMELFWPELAAPPVPVPESCARRRR